MKRFRRNGAIALTAIMLTQTFNVSTLFAAIPDPFTPPTTEELVANNYVLYFANCGTDEPTTVDAEDKMGLYQSKSDQTYGVDEVTGYEWGYVANDTTTKIERTGSGTNKSGVSWYSAPNPYVQNETGIYYDFEIPNGNYDIVIGSKNPWSGRDVDIVIEDQIVDEKVSLPQGQLVEKIYENVEVTDKKLNIKVHNPRRTSNYVDAVLSYIIVKAPISYTFEMLQAKIDNVTLTDADRSKYAKETVDNLDTKIAEAKKIITDGNEDTTLIKDAYEALELAYSNLRQLVVYDSFNPGQKFVDNNGVVIQAHGGAIYEFEDGKYYWYGEDKTLGYRPVGGVHLYTSTDLYNWTDEGVVLKTMESIDEFESDSYFKNLYGDYDEQKKKDTFRDLDKNTCVIERPKVIYNEKNDNYVMWFHADGPTETSDANYAKASAGVAVSDSPTGPFKLLGSYRLHECPPDQDDKHPSDKGMARDMNLFVDDDKTAYIIYSSEENLTMYISKLNDDYTYLATPPDKAVYGVDFIRNFPGAQREAPAVFKFDGMYYMVTSGATGWNPNQARYYMADSMLGEWKDMGDPCVGDTSKTTFRSQSTCVLPIDAQKGKFMYMGDRWVEADLANSRYIWLPVEFDAFGRMSIEWKDSWKLEDLKENEGKITIETKFPEYIFMGDSLPSTIEVSRGNQKFTTNVLWDNASLHQPGSASVKGTLTDLGNVEINADVLVIPKDMIYLINAGASETDDYKTMLEVGGSKVLNKVSEQIYDPENGNTWGYTNAESTGVNTGDNMFNSLRYIDKGKEPRDFSYKFDNLKAGEYTVYVGYYDPWSEWAKNRDVKVSINDTVVDEQRNISGSYTVGTYTYDMTEDGTMDINFAPVHTGDNTDIQISWIIISSKIEQPQPPKDITLEEAIANAQEVLKENNPSVGSLLNSISELSEAIIRANKK